MVRVPDYIRKAGSTEKVPALKENGNVVFTISFTRETWLSKKKYPQGTTGIVTRLIPAYSVKSGVWTSA
jgi:hypothetical protein